MIEAISVQSFVRLSGSVSMQSSWAVLRALPSQSAGAKFKSAMSLEFSSFNHLILRPDVAAFSPQWWAA
jgi:hypothetical protein